MKVGDLVKVKEWQKFKNAGKLGIITEQGSGGWWDIVFVDGQKGSVMRHVVEVISENR